MRISDGSSDVCSSDLTGLFQDRPRRAPAASQNQLTRPGARAEGPTLLAECTLVSTEGPGFCGDSGCSSAPRLQRSTDPVNLLYPFEVDRIHVVRRNRGAVPSDNDPI